MPTDFLIILYYLPLKESVVLDFNKLESPLPNNILCLVWFKIGLVVLVENVTKSTAGWTDKWTDSQTDGQTDAGQKFVRKAFKLSVKMSYK